MDIILYILALIAYVWFVFYMLPVIFAKNYADMLKKWRKTELIHKLIGLVVTVFCAIFQLLNFVFKFDFKFDLSTNADLLVIWANLVLIGFFVIYIRSVFQKPKK